MPLFEQSDCREFIRAELGAVNINFIQAGSHMDSSFFHRYKGYLISIHTEPDGDSAPLGHTAIALVIEQRRPPPSPESAYTSLRGVIETERAYSRADEAREAALASAIDRIDECIQNRRSTRQRPALFLPQTERRQCGLQRA